MPSANDFVYPQPDDGDDDDVVWALQAGNTEWQRGSNADALVWLRRAIEAANAAGNAFRAGEIQAAVDELMEVMWSGSEAANDLKVIDTSLEPDDLLNEPLDDSNLDDENLEEEAIEEGDLEEDLQADDEFDDIDDFDLEELEADELVAEEAWLEEGEAGDIVPELAAPIELPDIHTLAPLGQFEVSLSPQQDTLAQHEVDGTGAFEQQSAEAELPESVELEDAGPDAARSASLPTDLMALVTSVRASPMDLGSEPVDQAIAVVLESDNIRESLNSVSAVDLATNTVAPQAVVDGVPLGECLGFEDLPEDTLVALARSARLERLLVDEELSEFGAALVTHGAVAVVTAISDVPAMLATKGDVVFTRGSLADGNDLKVVGTGENTVVAVWPDDQLQAALQNCPWVNEALCAIADRFQALAGTTLGVLGERLDASLRRTVIDRMEVRVYAPGEWVIGKAVPTPGLFIVGAGRIELLTDDESSVESECLPGDFLFPEAVLSAAAVRCTARAGSKGALLLFASRHVAHELVTSVPPLLEALVS